MEEKKFETLKNFIKSNKSFLSALNNNSYPNLDIYTKYEIYLVYFRANLESIQKRNPSLAEKIMELLNSTNYYITEDRLEINGTIYPLSYLDNLLNEIEQIKKEPILINISPSYPSDNYFSKRTKEPCKIYSFKDYEHFSLYEMSERSLIYQYTFRVDKSTIPYIDKVRKNFNTFISFITYHLLKNDLKEVGIKDLQILYSYINLYPLLNYGKDLINFPYEQLTIPQNKIGLSKTTISNPEILKLKNNLQKITLQKSNLVNRLNILSLNLPKGHPKIDLITIQIRELEKQELEILYEIYSLSHYEHIYNPNILNYLYRSFCLGCVDVNNFFNNPFFKIFYIKNSNTEFYCALRLDTLIELLDNDQVLKILNDQPRLVLTS